MSVPSIKNEWGGIIMNMFNRVKCYYLGPLFYTDCVCDWYISKI